MSFIIDFVGLGYFQAQGGSTLVLLPDGRDFDGMTAHQANFYIEKARLIGRPDQQDWDWWDSTPNPTLDAYSLACFPIKEPVTLEITGLAAPSAGSTASAVESVRMDHLDHLMDLDPEMTIVPRTARTIARMEVGQGRFEAFLLRSRAPVTRLTSNHSGQIQISAHTNGGKTYTLTLRDEAEIVLANTPELFSDDGEVTQKGMHAMPMSMSHYVIYEQLAEHPDPNRMTPPDPARMLALPDCPSSQAFFVLLDGQTPRSDCGSTCCGK
jgi:hypothetical protein